MKPQPVTFTPGAKPASYRAAYIGVGSAIAFGVLLWLASERTPEVDAASEAQIRAKRTIDVCWEQQERKSLSPDAQRFLAGACEQFEEDYRGKYGRYYRRYGKSP